MLESERDRELEKERQKNRERKSGRQIQIPSEINDER